MKATGIYYINKLRDIFSERKSKNPNYSLRAYGRDLGIHPSSLSLIMKCKRAFPVVNFERMNESLRLDEVEQKMFLESIEKINFSTKKEVRSFLLKVSIPEETTTEADDLIRDFSKKIQNLGVKDHLGFAKKYHIRISWD